MTTCKKCGGVIAPEQQVDIQEFENYCYACYSVLPKHVCVDFDGVLAFYEGWKGPDHLGEPRPGAAEFIVALRGMGYEVVIHTTREPRKVWRWLDWHGLSLHIHAVTNEKRPAVVYIDDRALTFRGDFDRTLDELKHFLPYWKRPAPKPVLMGP